MQGEASSCPADPNLVPFGAASRVVLSSETRIRMAIMIEPWSCGELASEKVRAISVLPTSGFARTKSAFCPGRNSYWQPSVKS